MDETLLLSLTVATIALAGFVQSVTGFGFGLVSMALLPLFRGFTDAYFVIMIPNLIVCSMNFLANYKHFQWRQGLWLTIGSCAAVPVGYYIMITMDKNWLMLGLGILICFFSASELFMSKTRPLRLKESLGFPLGLFSGALSGAFNMGGPPAVAYVYSQTWAKEHIVALLQVVFGTSTIIRLILIQESDRLSFDLVKTSFIAILPLLASIYVGNRILVKLNREQLRLAVFLFLLVIGIKYTFKL